MKNKSLLLTEFEGYAISYGPRFFNVNLWPEYHELKWKKQGAVIIDSMDLENKVRRMFIMSSWKAHHYIKQSLFWNTDR